MQTRTLNGRTVYVPDNAPDKYFYTAAKALAYEKKYRPGAAAEVAALTEATRADKRTPRTKKPRAQGRFIPSTPSERTGSRKTSTLEPVAFWEPPKPRYIGLPEQPHPVFQSPKGRIQLVWDYSRPGSGLPVRYEPDLVLVPYTGTYYFDSLIGVYDPDGDHEPYSVELREGMTAEEAIPVILRALDAYPHREGPFPLSLFEGLHKRRNDPGSIRIVWGTANPLWLKSTHSVAASDAPSASPKPAPPKPRGKKATLQVEAAAVSEQGPRDYQEDRVRIDGNLVVVADGMGGHEGGDVAAQTAVDVISDRVRKGNSLMDAVLAAHRAVVALARGHRRNAPGAAVVAALFDPDAGTVDIVHSGDSRCTLVNERGRVLARTIDHNFAGARHLRGELGEDWVKPGPHGNMILQALGHDADPTTMTVRLDRGQTYVLTTDGVHDVLINDLEAIVGKNANASAGVIARKLVDQALPSTRDNATCAVVTIR